jgi:MioC protein
MHKQVKILVATMTGTAELVADEIADLLRADDLEVEVLAMDFLDPSILTDDAAYIICASTYGQGDVPDGALDFYDGLTIDGPDLTGLIYGMFGLGDRTYIDTFCDGPTKFDEALTQLGAKRIGTFMRHDRSSGTLPEDDAPAWVETWLAALHAQSAAA